MKPVAIVLAMLLAAGGLATAGQGAAKSGQRPTLAGRSLGDALGVLQSRGVKIVFSSEIVKPGMRVAAEPAGRTDREILVALLRPHGLDVREGPGALIVVRAPVKPPAAAPTLPTAGTIRGVVVDARTATPLAGVVVRVVGATALEVITDANGAFELTRVPPGSHTIFASLVGYSLARPEVEVSAGRVLEIGIPLSAGTATYTEEVTVTADAFRASQGSVPSATVITSGELLELRGVLSDDPLRAVQALPSVTAVNDFRSEFSIRGNDYRHIGLSVDGMTTDWPVHTVRDDASGGSVALINSDVVDQITLFGGAYPQDRPARTGGWVDFSLREGSRERVQVRGALSLTSASLILEGPIGRAQRGSWLVATRQSYVQWIMKRMNSNGSTAFGFSDVQGKGVFDLSPAQRVEMTVVAGQSQLDLRRDDDDPNLVSRGDANAVMVTAGWRATRGSTLTTLQRVSVSRYSFDNARRDAQALAAGTGGSLAYRGSMSWAARPSTVLQVGTHLQRDAADQTTTWFVERWSPAAVVARPERVDSARAIWSADARVTHSRAGWIIDAGALVSAATDTAGSRAPSPWFALTVPAGDRWQLRSAAGLYRQQPALDQTRGTFAGTGLRPESARHFEVALEHRPAGDIRLLVTGFARRERDMLRLVDSEYRVRDGALIEPSLTPVWMGVLDGSATGVELLLQRRASAGLSGWIAYSYTKTRYADRRTGERFAGDFDQRQTFSAYGQVRITPATSISAKLRLGSNVPLPGYLTLRDTGTGDALFVGEQRNGVRLPAYARLDLRANHAFNFDARRLTLFVELVNVTGRANYAPGYDAMRVAANGRVIASRQRLFPFLPTAGILVEF